MNDGFRKRLLPQNRRSGFGLIEILVVVVILLILAVILIPRLTGGKDASGKKVASPRERAKQAAGSEYIAQINQAIAMYRMDHDEQNPPNLQALRAYNVTDEMIKDPVTGQYLPYDPRTGRVGAASGGTGLPRVPGF